MLGGRTTRLYIYRWPIKSLSRADALSPFLCLPSASGSPPLPHIRLAMARFLTLAFILTTIFGAIVGAPISGTEIEKGTVTPDIDQVFNFFSTHDATSHPSHSRILRLASDDYSPLSKLGQPNFSQGLALNPLIAVHKNAHNHGQIESQCGSMCGMQYLGPR